MEYMRCAMCKGPIHYEGDPKRFGEEFVMVNGLKIHTTCFWRWLAENERVTRDKAQMMHCSVCGRAIDSPGEFDKTYFEINGEKIHDSQYCLNEWIERNKKERHCWTEK